MLTTNRVFFTFLVVLFIFSCTSRERLSSIKGMPEGVPTKKVHIVGQNCIWSPNSVHIQEGTHVIMEIESLDIPYKCDMQDYNLNFNVPAGRKVTAEFYAPAANTLEFGCNIENNFHYQWGGVAGKLTLG